MNMKIKYQNEELTLFTSTYANNDALYVGLKDSDGEYYGDITVNLPNSHTLPSDCAFVNENNTPGIGRILTETGVATPLFQSARSGYCTYFAYRFNLELLNS